MVCNEYSDLLERLREGELTQKEHETLKRHAETCAQCRFELTMMDDLKTLHEDEDVPPAFTASWQSRLREENHAPVKRLPQVTKWVAMAATLVLLLIGAYKAGDLDLLGVRRMESDASVSYGTVAAQKSRMAEPLAEVPDDLSQNASVMMAAETSEADFAPMDEAAPAPKAAQSKSEEPVTAAPHVEDRMLGIPHEYLIYLLTLAALVLLALLIYEKRKQK